MYWSGAPMKNVTPVSAASANPNFAQGISVHAALMGTRFMNPSSRRSKKPAMPMRSERPKKCRSRTGPEPGVDANRFRDRRPPKPGRKEIERFVHRSLRYT